MLKDFNTFINEAIDFESDTWQPYIVSVGESLNDLIKKNGKLNPLYLGRDSVLIGDEREWDYAENTTSHGKKSIVFSFYFEDLLKGFRNNIINNDTMASIDRYKDLLV